MRIYFFCINLKTTAIMQNSLKKSFVLLLLIGLWSCDSFKNNNPTPSVEVVNKSVLSIVKLHYPNATEIRVREMIPNRLWEVQFFDGNQSITLSIDNNNQILRFSNTSRLNNELLDLPDKIISYIKENFHPNVSIQRATLRLDENGGRLLFVVNITAHDGHNNNGTTLYFDMQANIVAPPALNPNKDLGKFIRQSWIFTAEGVPEKIKSFIAKNQFNRYGFSNEGSSKQAGNIEGSYSVQRNNFANGSNYILAVYHPIERISPAFTGPGERAMDFIYFNEDGTFLQWDSWALNSTRGSKMEVVTTSQLTNQTTQLLNQMFGNDTWNLTTGFDNYLWFTRSGQFLQIELKNQSETFYDFYLACDGNLSEGFQSGSVYQYQLIKQQQDVPDDTQKLLNQRFANWKVIFGRKTLGQKRIPTGEVTPATFINFDMRVEAEGKLYDVNNGKGPNDISITVRSF